MLPTTFFVSNRRQLIQNITPEALIVIAANSLLQRSGDTTFPFRQDSNFFYLTGIDEPDVVLVLHGDEEFLILPKRSEVETIFGGSIDKNVLAKLSGVKLVYTYQEGWARYKHLQRYKSEVYMLGRPPARVSGIDSFFTNPARQYLHQKLRRMNKDITIKDIRPQLSALRQRKQPPEIAAIEEAITLTHEGFRQVRQLLKAGVKEYELEAVFEAHFKKHQVKQGYQPIVASGAAACVLHYTKNNQTLGNKQLCLLDVGAEYHYYSADITRTYGVNFTERQHQVVEAVKMAQQQIIALLKPGLEWKQYAQAAQKIVGEQLVKLGLINTISSEQVRPYFPHGVSHSLGLDVHDVCDYKTIDENMVITVEPGIYIPEEGIGVRIEDDVLITKTGAKNLSAHIPY